MDTKIKKYFFLGMGAIIMVSILLIGYGAYLNKTSETKISDRMEDRALEVQASKAVTRSLSPSVKLSRANMTSDEMADAVALINGKISSVPTKRHQLVQQGEVIMTLVNEELPAKLSQADGDILKAEAQLNQARSNYNRYSHLLELHGTSVEKTEEMEMQYRTAQAQLAQAHAQKEQILVNQSYQQVTAPLSGELVMLYRSPGSYVTAGTAVALVGDFQTLKFTFDLDDNDENMHFLRHFQNQDMLLSVNPEEMSKVFGTDFAAGNQGKAQQFRARVIEISPDFAEDAALRRVTIEVDNSSHLLEPHIYRDVRLSAGDAISCLTVPDDALDHEKRHLFVVDDDGIVHEREVRTGSADDNYVEILSGVEPGDVVVISDQDGLTDGMKVNMTLVSGEGED